MLDRNLRKLDHDLGLLLREGAWANRATFPVIATARPEAFGALVTRLEQSGVWIRQVMKPISAVSAYLSIELIAELLADDAVVELELAQPIDLAGK